LNDRQGGDNVAEKKLQARQQKVLIESAFRNAAIDGRKVSRWVINCRAAWPEARQLYPS
jgi:hypothetical protein